MHIILLNFDYPPNPGIGGRRWAKLSRELAEQGAHIHVIKAKYRGKKTSSWSELIDHPHISIHELEPISRLQEKFSSIHVLNSLFFRLELLKMKWLEKGTPYDKSIGMKDSFLNTMKTIAEQHPISWIIATGAPFNLPYYAALFKQNHKNIKLWVDFRDPWLKASNYGMSQLSANRYDAELKKAKVILENADVISSPTSSALIEFDVIASKQEREKYYELSHFADTSNLPSSTSAENNLLTITYGGAMYHGTEVFLEAMAKHLLYLKENNPSTYKNIRIQFFSPDFEKLKRVFEMVDAVTVHEDIGNAIFEAWSTSDYALILLAAHNKDFLTTKFYECLSLKKPLLYIGPDGKVIHEILQKGYGITWETLIKNLEQDILLKTENTISVETLYSISLAGRTKELIEKMKSL